MKTINNIIRIVVLFTIIALCIILIPKYKEQERNQLAKPEVTLREYIASDSMQVADKIILDKLVPVLMKREGLSDTIYYDKKGNAYIGYGHLITEAYIPVNIKITKERAKELLIQDIRKAYFERQRIMRKTLYPDVYSIFISGHLNCKEK